VWGRRLRLRFSNAFGKQPLVLGAVRAGIQASAGQLLAGTNRVVMFDKKPTATIAPGETRWSDAVELPLTDAQLASMDGRKLAVSLFLPGPTGPMTWHAKALQTSYASPQNAGDVTDDA